MKYYRLVDYFGNTKLEMDEHTTSRLIELGKLALLCKETRKVIEIPKYKQFYNEEEYVEYVNNLKRLVNMNERIYLTSLLRNFSTHTLNTKRKRAAL